MVAICNVIAFFCLKSVVVVVKHSLTVYDDPHFSHITYLSNTLSENPKYFLVMYNDAGNEVITVVAVDKFEVM